MTDKDDNIIFAKTALSEQWEIVRVNRHSGIVTKHIKEVPIHKLEGVFIDFAEFKFKELGSEGFTLKPKGKGIKITVEPLEEGNTSKTNDPYFDSEEFNEE